MIDNLKPLIPIVFGWILGWFTPLVTELFRKKITESELKKSIRIELMEFQCRMALAVFYLDPKYDRISAETLLIIKKVLDKYSGRNPVRGVQNSVEILLRSSDAEVAAYNQSRADALTGVTLRRYVTPLLDAKLPLLSSVKEDLRNKILELKVSLEMLEEIRQDAKYYLNLTFQNLPDKNRDIVNINFVESYKQYSDRAKTIISLIDELNL